MTYSSPNFVQISYCRGAIITGSWILTIHKMIWSILINTVLLNTTTINQSWSKLKVSFYCYKWIDIIPGIWTKYCQKYLVNQIQLESVSSITYLKIWLHMKRATFKQRRTCLRIHFVFKKIHTSVDFSESNSIRCLSP